MIEASLPELTVRPTIEVTLVHGTWGRMRLPFSGARWFDEDSEFSIALRRLLGNSGATIKVQSLEWSGNNSLEARRRAASRLQSNLWRQANRNADTLQVIIGHSHGGSVCLLALRDLPEGIDPVIITLATPFVEVVDGEPKGRAAAVMSVISGGFGPVLLLAVVPIVEQLFQIPALGWLFQSAAMFTLAANTLTAVYGLPRKQDPNEKESELDWLRPQKHNFQFFTQSTAKGATIAPPRRALILRGLDDEAGLVLAAGSIGSRILSAFVSLSFRTTTVLTIIFAALVSLGLAEIYAPQLTPLKSFIGSLLVGGNLIYFAYGCIAAIYLLPLISGIFKCVYGRELLLGGYFCEIKSASVPDATSGMSVVTLPPDNRSGMRHAIYRHEQAPSTIVNFIQASMPKSA